jgi:predicted metalloprotease with PDZ domain
MRLHSPIGLFTLLACFAQGISAQQTAASAPSTQPSPALVYHLDVPGLKPKTFHVTIRIEHPTEDHVDFAIPAWTPGYYQILSYETHIDNVHAEDGHGSGLPVLHPSRRVWEVTGSGGRREPIQISYDLHAMDEGFGFFGSALQNNQAYMNGASALMYVVGHTDLSASLSVSIPSDWKLATGLEALASIAGSKPSLPGRTGATASYLFRAKDYDELIDCPMQFGRFDAVDFQSDGVRFRCVLVGNHQADVPRLTATLTRIVHTAIQVFGSAPFPRYVFFYHIGGGGFYGGLEHRNSTVIHLGNPIRDGGSDDFLTTTAHEFFHAWNVKYLRPSILGPFDYTQPVRTTSLWWAEGVTDYYAYLILLRSGLRDRDWFVRTFSDRIAELDNDDARVRVSLEEASSKAWEGGSMGFDGLSYYLKGSLVGLYFDLKIRELTEGHKTLDSAMRELAARYGRQGLGYPEDALLKVLDSVAGADLQSDYERYVRGTEEIVWQQVFSPAGLDLYRDRSAYLGIHIAKGDRGKEDSDKETHDLPATVADVERGMAADRMGLRPGDTIAKINNRPVTADSLTNTVQELAPDSPISLAILRDGKSLVLKGVSGSRYSGHQVVVTPEAQLTGAMRRIFPEIH